MVVSVCWGCVGKEGRRSRWAGFRGVVGGWVGRRESMPRTAAGICNEDAVRCCATLAALVLCHAASHVCTCRTPNTLHTHTQSGASLEPKRAHFKCSAGVLDLVFLRLNTALFAVRNQLCSTAPHTGTHQAETKHNSRSSSCEVECLVLHILYPGVAGTCCGPLDT